MAVTHRPGSDQRQVLQTGCPACLPATHSCSPRRARALNPTAPQQPFTTHVLSIAGHLLVLIPAHHAALLPLILRQLLLAVGCRACAARVAAKGSVKRRLARFPPAQVLIQPQPQASGCLHRPCCRKPHPAELLPCTHWRWSALGQPPAAPPPPAPSPAAASRSAGGRQGAQGRASHLAARREQQP